MRWLSTLVLAPALCAAVSEPGVSLTVSPGVIITAPPAVVEVAWKGVNVTPNTTLGVYYQDPSINGSYPYGVWPVAQTSGSMSATMIDMGVKDGVYWFELQGAVVRVVFSPKVLLLPRAPRVALTPSSPYEMRVMWTTNGPQEQMTVQYVSTEGGDWRFGAVEPSNTYTAGDLCAAPATENLIPPGTQHDVVLGGLSPSTTYTYQIQFTDGENVFYDRNRTFVSAPANGGDSHVVVYGDLGTSMPFHTVVPEPFYANYPPAAQTLKWMQDKIARAGSGFNVMHMGDISYARGYSYVWPWFMTQTSAVMETVSGYMVGIGNHEYDFCYPGLGRCQSFEGYGNATYHNDSHGECGIPYWSRFHMPEPPSAFSPPAQPWDPITPRNLWYSYNYGVIHFTVISTEHDFTEGSTQWEFVKQDWESVDRSVTPWLVFIGHRPMYTSTQGGTFTTVLQDAFESMMQKYNVDVAFWGHVHQYERTKPISYNGTVVGAGHGTTHVVVGNSGNTYQVPWANRDGDPHEMLPPDWIVFRTKNFGVSQVTANAESFKFEFIGDVEYLVHDTFTLNAAKQAWRKEGE